MGIPWNLTRSVCTILSMASSRAGIGSRHRQLPEFLPALAVRTVEVSLRDGCSRCASPYRKWPSSKWCRRRSQTVSARSRTRCPCTRTHEALSALSSRQERDRRPHIHRRDGYTTRPAANTLADVLGAGRNHDDRSGHDTPVTVAIVTAFFAYGSGLAPPNTSAPSSRGSATLIPSTS